MDVIRAGHVRYEVETVGAFRWSLVRNTINYHRGLKFRGEEKCRVPLVLFFETGFHRGYLLRIALYSNLNASEFYIEAGISPRPRFIASR